MPCEECPRGQECHDETKEMLQRIADINKDLTCGRLMLAIDGLDALKFYIIRMHNKKNGREI